MTSLGNSAGKHITNEIEAKRIISINIKPSLVSNPEWDLFVGRCGCSYRCLYRASWFLHGNYRSFFKIRRLDVILNVEASERKIGQVIIVTTRKIKIFSDQLQLLPEWQHLWHDVMKEIFQKIGPGQYRYGSEWMTGPCRVEALQQFPSVEINSIKRANLEVVDFSNWPDWNSYWASISKNVVRNYNKYVRQNESQGLNIIKFTYSSNLFLDVFRIKSSTLIGKGIPSSKMRIYIKSAMRYYILSSHIKFVTCAASDRRLDSFAACVAIGSNTYYLDGGSLKLKAGSGWFTLMSAIRHAYHASEGKGLFVMGPVDDATVGKAHWIGLEKSRHQCRVLQRPVSVVDFMQH